MEVINLFTHRYTLTVPDEMHERLEEERKRRYLNSVPELIRMILSEHLSDSKYNTREINRNNQ
jgi:hypothetical protein